MNDISIIINIPTLIFLTFTLLVIGVCLFLIGYFLGKQQTVGVSNSTKPVNFFESIKNSDTKIIIDDAKFVTDIKTDHLEKKYDSLGDIKKSEENINSSISKLKNMKR
jgi:hypothetical protein